MTLAATTNRISYNGDGSTVAFSVPFRFDASADLRVILRSADGVETVQTITTHYTLSGLGNPGGGTVTMVTAPASGTRLVILRQPALTQPTDLQVGGEIPSETLEAWMDRTTQQIQSLQEQVNRALKFAETSTQSGVAFPEPVASNLLRWNGAATGLENVTLASLSPTSIVVSTFMQGVLDDADATAARASLGLVIGTNVQAYDVDLAALAGLTSAADRLPYFTGAGTAALATFTSFARTLLDDADAATARGTLGAQAALGFTPLNAASVSAFGASFIDDADAATGRATLGLLSAVVTTETRDLPSIAAGTSTSYTYSGDSGAALGDLVFVAGEGANSLFLAAYVIASGSIRVEVRNITGGSIDAASQTIRYWRIPSARTFQLV